MYKVILFDLDGTLTESGEGITKSVQYALEKLGKPEDDLKKLEVFVGPPLLQQFMEYAGLDEETGIKAVEYYRESIFYSWNFRKSALSWSGRNAGYIVSKRIYSCSRFL